MRPRIGKGLELNGFHQPSTPAGPGIRQAAENSFPKVGRVNAIFRWSDHRR